MLAMRNTLEYKMLISIYVGVTIETNKAEVR